MGYYSDVELLIIEKFTEAIGDIIDAKESSQWDKDKLMFAACINDEEKEKTTRKVIKKLQKKLTKCSPDIAEFLRCYINPSENDLKVSSGYGFRFNLIRNFLFQEFSDVLKVLTVKFKNIEEVENVDFIEWEEMVVEGLYGIDNKFMLHFINYMVIASRLVTFKSFIVSDTNSNFNQPPVLNKLFSYFEKLNELEEIKNLDFQDHINRYGNDNFIEIDLKFDIDSEPWKESILIEIDKTYKKAKEHNIYFFDCPFDVYKNHFKKRNENYFNENIDATELDFLLSEVGYFSNPEKNRVFIKNNNSYNYSSYFEPKENFVISLKRKLEFLAEKLKKFNRAIDFSFLEPSPLGFTGINVLEIQNDENNKSMIPNSTWDYPLNNPYKWYEMILNSFIRKTDIDNPLFYFKTEFKKRDDVFEPLQFYNYCIEYTTDLKNALIELKANELKLPPYTYGVKKQIYDCDHIWEVANSKLDSVFNPENKPLPKKVLKIDETSFNKVINTLQILNGKKVEKFSGSTSIKKTNNKLINRDLNHQSFTLKKYYHNEQKLTDLRSSLISKNFIHNETTLKDFRKIFSGKEIKNPVIWIGRISELNYFIKRLHNELELVDNLKQKHWGVAVRCFVQKNQLQFIRERLKNQKVPSTSKVIDSALNTLK